MAVEVYTFQVSVPAATPIATPITQQIAIPVRELIGLRWRVPPGPAGLMGWQLSIGGVQVIPRNAGSWVVANDESDTWTLSRMPDSGAWQITAYNLGTLPHSVYVTLLADLPSVNAGSVAAIGSPIPNTEVF